MAAQTQIYDQIGKDYSVNRRADPRIADFIRKALGNAATVLNVGAGAGSYETAQAWVVALEPSRGMIRQRPQHAAPAVRATAEALPFPDKSFDASMALLTVHHWSDPDQGLRELMRVPRERVVILTWDPSFKGFWLTRDYFPELTKIHHQMFPELDDYKKTLGKITTQPVPIPHDCADGFLGAYWRRPQAYLDPKVRGAMSAFSKIQHEARGVAALQKDLVSGAWEKCNTELLGQDSLDLGYRLLIKKLS